MQRTKNLGFLAAYAKNAVKSVPSGGDAAACSGLSLLDRPVTIFAPARSAMQQGMGRVPAGGMGPCWKLAYPTQEKWQYPINGWTATGDPLENVARASNGMVFESAEDAVAYCERYGIKYTVRKQAPKFLTRPKRYNAYGDNYSVFRKGIPEGGLRSMQEAPAKGKKA